MIEEKIEAQNSSRFDTLISEGSEKLDWAIPKAPLSFRFTWEKLVFSAKLDKVDDHHRLRILGDLGPLPFSAEKPKFRERLLNLLAWDTEDERVRFVLEPNRHEMFLMIDDRLDGELTGLKLITSAVMSLLHARPYIELAKEVGWQHPSDSIPKDFNVVPLDSLEHYGDGSIGQRGHDKDQGVNTQILSDVEPEPSEAEQQKRAPDIVVKFS